MQDRWKRHDPKGRARDHYVIAKRLWGLQHDKAAVEQEFALAPNWGRARLILLAESLRHLARACEGAPLGPRPQGEARRFKKNYFPDLPKDGWCDPNDVVNFCFQVIFTQEMNGGRSQRLLARRHGAYELVADTLSLLSRDGRLGKEHPALHEANIPAYLRECALAQLDLGRLAEAQANLEALVERAGEPTDPKKAGHLLDLVVVLAARHDLATAEAHVDKATKAWEHLMAHPVPKDVVRPDPRSRPPLESLGIRIRVRKAHLNYLKGDLEAVMAAYQALEAEYGPEVITRDFAHPYIATLGALSTQGGNMLDQAYALAIRMERLTDRQGLHHEQLGFRIALAHIKRKTGLVEEAEILLDGVQENILNEGCSERTYQAFLREAGSCGHGAGALRPGLHRVHPAVLRSSGQDGLPA